MITTTHSSPVVLVALALKQAREFVTVLNTRICLNLCLKCFLSSTDRLLNCLKFNNLNSMDLCGYNDIFLYCKPSAAWLALLQKKKTLLEEKLTCELHDILKFKRCIHRKQIYDSYRSNSHTTFVLPVRQSIIVHVNPLCQQPWFHAWIYLRPPSFFCCFIKRGL